MGRRTAAALAAVALLTGCSATVSGTATWPGARLEKVLLTAADVPPGARYDRIVDEPEQLGGSGGPPPMLTSPQGCSDALTRVIEETAERGPGSAGEYMVAYDGARIVMTVLTWNLDLDRLQAAAERCARFETFFDPSDEGIPMTTTRLQTARPDALVYQQTLTLAGVDSSVYFSFENVGSMGVFGIAFPTPNPDIVAKGDLPQTFLEISGKQAARMDAG
ncbi:hypothetical protein JRC04_06535 [Mycolicibacterium sp. S2-37]|uniref:hypothetical protein n=1 Tax=Mycolicibacterium sp. S2-37 TaxID=2810297 RepID=UPI001A93C505|nr:hypothetical protein [Mycolicibacterium sp. S2-37]MBO0677116.1 hypothetical protein [Mycolicibacterium sp. S2-37]